MNLGVAKDQRLSLNPAQISGACGRLMCCLRYEHEFYVQARKRFPKEAKILVTALGEEKVVANDIFGERVTLRNAEGETRVVALADLKREMAGGPATVEEPAVEEEPDIMLELDEEVIRMTDTAERPAFRPGWRPGMPPPPIGERPVPLQRRPSGASEGAPPPKGDGPGDDEQPSAAREVRRPDTESARKPSRSDAPRGAPRGNAPQKPADRTANGTPQPPAAQQEDSATPTGEDEVRAPRRRRGRRGGRRGRGRAEDGTTLPNAGRPDGAAGATVDDDGEEGDA